jgi:hypothetical protein
MLLLVASITFTALGLVEANRAIGSPRTVAEHALRDYAGFVSWSYQQASVCHPAGAKRVSGSTFPCFGPAPSTSE